MPQRPPLPFVWVSVGLLAAAIPVAYYWGHTSRPPEAVLPDVVSADFELGEEPGTTAFRYTAPIPLKRLSTEWEPQRALAMGISFPASMAAPDIAVYEVQLLEIAHQYLDVLVFSEHDHNRAHAYFLSLIDSHPQAASIMAKTHFIDSRNLMRWTRDYGPIFGVDQQNDPVAIDFVYRNLTRDLEEAAYHETDSFRHFMTLQGDAMPADLAVELQNRYDMNLQVVRPPLWMDGGDFIHDGRGNVFVSRQTLVRNGGNRHALAEVFRLYFGAKKLHVLEALPGATVNHLDMILKFVNEDTVLIPEFHHAPAESLNPYRRALSRQVREILERNETYLRKHFPDRRLVKVPMPPIMFKSQTEILAEAQTEFLHASALQKRLLSPEAMNQLDPTARAELEAQTRQLITTEIGSADFSTIEGFNAILRHYGQVPFDKYFDLHSEAVTRYRSYINSVFLHASNGNHAFVVPRFTSPDPTESRQLREWEQQAAAAYRVAWPQANIHWINCDAMVTDMGFIHCTTITVPGTP